MSSTPLYPKPLAFTNKALEQERDAWSQAVATLNEERQRLTAEVERLREVLGAMLLWSDQGRPVPSVGWRSLCNDARAALDSREKP